ncbi:MAG: DUF333 domain-containing protein [bacterium]
MKKILFFMLVFVVLSLTTSCLANAQEVVNNSNVNTQTMGSINLNTKDVGMLPTSPFYFLKNWGRGINKFFTFDSVKKAGLELQEINERAAEIKKIEEIAPQNIKVINEASSNYQKSAGQLKNRLETLKQTSQNPNVDKILNNLVDSSIKHQKLFSDLEKKIEASQGISGSGITELKKSFEASRGSIDGASNVAKNTLYQIYTEQKTSAGRNPTQGASAGGEPAVGNMPNPASAYCQKLNYKLEIKTDSADGQYGVCIFSDGNECEEWAFFRGECGKEYTREILQKTSADQNTSSGNMNLNQNTSARQDPSQNKNITPNTLTPNTSSGNMNLNQNTSARQDPSQNKNITPSKCPTLVPPSPDSCKDGKWITEKTSSGCSIFKCNENYNQETIPSISEKDLEQGWYYGQKSQKKTNTPNNWVWRSAGKSSSWSAPWYIKKQGISDWCGNGKCEEPNEHVFMCYEDCKPKPPEPTKPMLNCGNGTCQKDEGENIFSCNKDCMPVCGDNKCFETETCSSCSQDCGECPKMLNCGDGICQQNEGENIFSCNKDCRQ